jgi:predicted nucleic acid-binding protein
VRLVVDASILVEEGLRSRGRRLLRDPALDLAVAEEAWSETEYERRKRLALLVERGNLEPAQAVQLAAEGSVIDERLTVASVSTYLDRLEEARWRVPRDPQDVPTVALALAFDCGIWTSDRDFFGCGLPVWSTEVLQHHLESMPQSLPDVAPPP